MSDVEDIPEGFVDDLRNGLTYEQAENEYSLSIEETDALIRDMDNTGYNIVREEIGAEQETAWFLSPAESEELEWDEELYEFAIISDTHLGSNAEQLDSLHDFYDRVKDRDIDVVFHSGDITDGYEIYRGHVRHLQPEAARSWNDVIEYAAENYPEREGVDTFFIEGNHDAKYFKKVGKHLGEELDRKREDLHFLGQGYANIELTDDVDLDLVHPDGGRPYTLGYRAQTWLRDKPDSEKADITVFGHLHQFLNAETEGSQAMYAGAWQGDTPYLLRKGIKPKSGGWIIEMSVDDGEIREWSADRIQYPVESDLRNADSQSVQSFLEETKDNG